LYYLHLPGYVFHSTHVRMSYVLGTYLSLTYLLSYLLTQLLSYLLTYLLRY